MFFDFSGLGVVAGVVALMVLVIMGWRMLLRDTYSSQENAPNPGKIVFDRPRDPDAWNKVE